MENLQSHELWAKDFFEDALPDLLEALVTEMLMGRTGGFLSRVHFVGLRRGRDANNVLSRGREGRRGLLLISRVRGWKFNASHVKFRHLRLATGAKNGRPELEDENEHNVYDPEQGSAEETRHADDGKVDEIKHGQDGVAVEAAAVRPHQQPLQPRDAHDNSRQE